MNAKQAELYKKTSFQLYRMLFKSIGMNIKTEKGKKFLKERIREKWREHRNDTDPVLIEQLFLRAHATLLSTVDPEELKAHHLF